MKYNNENHGQRKRYKRHIANVSIASVIIISALQIAKKKVIETFAICRLFRFLWPWFSLLGYLALPLFVCQTCSIIQSVGRKRK